MTELSTDIEELLSGLNDPQREAVTHGEGPLLILAGAGSGKTRVLTHRIAYLVATDAAKPNEILAITFTNKAAGEMRDRAELLVGRRVRAMWVMTFHSACARMLRAHADRLGYTRQFTIYDQADSRRLVKRCLDELGVDPKRFTPASVQNQISDAKNKLRDADDYGRMVGSFFEQTVADVYRSYERELHRMNAMDFDDLLVRAVNVLELFPEVRERYANGFRHVLVDEYQDTNHAQYRWLQLLAGEHRNLMVVGDDAQAIYGFRGADIRNILDFEDTFPDARVIKLEQNYRSTQTILDAANAVIRNNRAQKPKSLWTELGQGDPIKVRELEDEHAEARFVTGEIQRLVDEGDLARGDRRLLPDQRAVAGARGHARARRDRLPGDRRHEVLRARRDQGRDRVPDRARQPSGRRRVHADRQLAAARDRLDVGVARAGVREHDGDVGLGRRRRARAGPGARPGGGQGAAALHGHDARRCASAPSPARRSPRCCRELLQETGYLDALEAERTIEAQGRIENLEELVNVAAEYDAAERSRASGSLAEFLQQVALIADADERATTRAS